MDSLLKVDTSLAQFATQVPKITQTDDYQKLKEQTDKFEAFFIKQIFDIALKSENPLFGKDASDKIYASMYHDALSQAGAGHFGYSQLLFNYLKENQ